mmetsp:Transcript_13445/g.38049  ORF Transcript_13445/g.38049 Transcript_13445/m.38049 type:complete len:652 (-) Transcript_13445:88-2043(-)
MAGWRGAVGLSTGYAGLPQSLEKDISGDAEFHLEKCTAAFLLDPAVVVQGLAVLWCWISYVLSAPFTYFQLLPMSAAAAVAAARVYSLKPLQAELCYFKEENTKFRNHNEQLNSVAESLHSKNRALERSICDLEHVREALERYAEKTHGDVGAVLAEVKSSIVEQERSIAEQKRIQKKTQAIQRRQRGTLDLLLQSSLMSLRHGGAGGVADRDFNELYAMLPASVSASLAVDAGSGGEARNLPDMLRETMGRLRELDADEAAEDEALERASAAGSLPGTPGWQQTSEGPAPREVSRSTEGAQDGCGPGALRRLRSGVHMAGMDPLFGPVQPATNRGRSAEPPEAAQEQAPPQGPFGMVGTYRLPVRSRSRERRSMEVVPSEEDGHSEVSEHPGYVVPPRGPAGCAQKARDCAPSGTSARSVGSTGGARFAAAPQPDRPPPDGDDDPPTARVFHNESSTARPSDSLPRVGSAPTWSAGSSLGQGGPAPRAHAASSSRPAGGPPARRREEGQHWAPSCVPEDEPLTARGQPHDQVAPLLPSWSTDPGGPRSGACFVTFAEHGEDLENDEPPTHRGSARSDGTIYSPQSSGRGPPPQTSGRGGRLGAGAASLRLAQQVAFKTASPEDSTATASGYSPQWSSAASGLGEREFSYN